MTARRIPIALFNLGRIVASANALRSLTQDDIRAGIDRHRAGQWGDLTSDDRSQNDLALEQGGRLLSVYHSATGAKFYVITEADRSVTIVLLPEDY